MAVQASGRTDMSSACMQRLIDSSIADTFLEGRMAPRTAAMDPIRSAEVRGGGGTSLGEWEHNNNVADTYI